MEKRLNDLSITNGGVVDAPYGSGLSFRDPDNIASSSSPLQADHPCQLGAGCRRHLGRVAGLRIWNVIRSIVPVNANGGS